MPQIRSNANRAAIYRVEKDNNRGQVDRLEAFVFMEFLNLDHFGEKRLKLVPALVFDGFISFVLIIKHPRQRTRRQCYMAKIPMVCVYK